MTYITKKIKCVLRISLFLLWLIIAIQSHGQAIRLAPATNRAEPEQRVVVDVILEVPSGSASGIAAAVTLPAGLTVEGTPSRSWYTQAWRDVSIEPRVEGNVLHFAAALKSGGAACGGQCVVARFEVFAVSDGTYPMTLQPLATLAMENDGVEIPFQHLHGASIVIGEVTPASIAEALFNDYSNLTQSGDGFLSLSTIQALFPGFTATDLEAWDFSGDGRLSRPELQAAKEGTTAVFHPADTSGTYEISLAEATSYAGKFVRGELTITLGQATRFAAIFVGGGCYKPELSDAIGFVSTGCE